MIHMIRTIVLFLITVAAVPLLVTVNLNIIGLDVWSSTEFNSFLFLQSCGVLLIVTGVFISILFSRFFAKYFMQMRIINVPQTAAETRLYQTVMSQSKAVGIKTPQIVIYRGKDINAFATGFQRNHAMLAVSQQLLDVMTQDEMEGVIAHEISHIANSDMLILALIQGFVNTVVYLPAYCVHFLTKYFLPSGSRQYNLMFYLSVSIMQLAFGWLASLIVMRFSRKREFYADQGGACIAGQECMIRALECLQASTHHHNMNTGFLYGTEGQFRYSIFQLFTSHPSLSERISALRSSDAVNK